MNSLDKSQRIFDYTYVVPEDIKIEDPLTSASFENTNHIYNKFTICQPDVGSFETIKVLNTVKN